MKIKKYLITVCIFFFLILILYCSLPYENRIALKLQLKGYTFIYNSYGKWRLYPTHFLSYKNTIKNDILMSLKAMPHLCCVTIKDGTLEKLDFEIFTKLSNLSHLDIHDCSGLTSQDIQKLSGCQKLTSLSINGFKLYSDDLVLLRSCPLKQLILISDDLTDNELEVISSFSHVNWLILSDNPHISDTGLFHVVSMQNLATIDVSRTGVTRNGIDRFRVMRPDIKIRCDFFNDID